MQNEIEVAMEVFRALVFESMKFWYNMLPDEVQNLIYDAVLGADDDMGL